MKELYELYEVYLSVALEFAKKGQIDKMHEVLETMNNVTKKNKLRGLKWKDTQWKSKERKL